MSKFVKIILLGAYSFILIRYLKNSISSSKSNVELAYLITERNGIKNLRTLLKLYKNNVTALKSNFKRLKRFPSDLKYILKYTNAYVSRMTSFDINGQETFIQNKCKYINCFLTNNKELLLDIRNYDAILYHVENTWDETLALRELYQKYIFVASEASANYPLCDPYFNNYYNMTITYKLNSDIPWTYFKITDKLGNIVGPRVNMTWIDPMAPTPMDVKEKIFNKTRAAAWFVSNCKTKNNRLAVTKDIQNELSKLGHVVDIFGWCGKRTCPQDRFADCLSLLDSDYYFYLSFENCFSDDYVTEALLYPLQYHTVPIVYGGANYSRFLPPNSYIDARKLNATEVAIEMVKAINNSTVYEDYFRWHNYYEYIDNSKSPDVCKLCQILNEDTHVHSSYKNFLDWWNAEYYLTKCSEGQGRVLVKDNIFLKPLQGMQDSTD